jgi:hypothetical protein
VTQRICDLSATPGLVEVNQSYQCGKQPSKACPLLVRLALTVVVRLGGSEQMIDSGGTKSSTAALQESSGSGMAVPYAADGALRPDNAAAILAPIASFARLTGSSARCAYRWVVATSLWPSSAPINGSEKPAAAPTAA